MVKYEDKVLSVIKSRTDKRERKGIESLLKESQELYHTLFENSCDAIYITSANREIVDVNPGFLDLFGYTKNELKRLNASRFYVDPNKIKEFIRIGQWMAQYSNHFDG